LSLGLKKSVFGRFSVFIAGVGGQGVVYAGRMLSLALFEEGKYVSLRYTYGAEVTGTPVYSEVKVDLKPIVSPYVEDAEIAVVMHGRALNEALKRLSCDGLLIVDEIVELPEDLVAKHIYRKPFIKATRSGRAGELGRYGTIAALGFLSRLGLIRLESLMRVAERGREADTTIEALRLGFKL